MARDEKIQKIHTIREGTIAQVRSALNDDQKKKFDAMVQQQEQRMQQQQQQPNPNSKTRASSFEKGVRRKGTPFYFSCALT